MCGIVGIHHLKALDSRKHVQQMMKALAHRGPDAQDICCFNRICLGHHRLSIFDTEAKANQPMMDDDGMHALVFNGAIYNYVELREELAHYPFKTQSDTEVLLAALKEWGIAALNRLEGMFAFAWWNEQQKELIIVRDRFGIKPLYYSLVNQEFIFASEIRAILASGLVPRKLNHNAFQYYLQFQSVLSPETLVQGVQSVEPGWYVKVSDEQLSTHQWYEPQVMKQTENSSIEELLISAVSQRLRSDVPIGLFLSAGIDSSLLAGIIRKKLDKPLTTLTVGFEEEAYNEGNEAQLWAKKIGSRHHQITLNQKQLLAEIDEVISHYDHPSGDGINTFFIAREAKKIGLKAALSGLGSDELFAGYPHFKQLHYVQQQKWLLSFPMPLRKLVSSVVKARDGSISERKKAELICNEYYDLAHTYPSSRKLMPDDWWFKLANTKNIVNPLANRLQDQTTFKSLMHGWPFISQLTLAEFQAYLEPVLLKDTDQMAMANALEVRTPFLDHKLLEHVLAIPDYEKLGSQPKQILTNAFKHLLDDELINRPKTGFTFPWDVWLRNDLQSWADKHLNNLCRRSIINGAFLQKIWKQFQANPKKVNWSRVWYLIVFEHWMENNNIEA